MNQAEFVIKELGGIRPAARKLSEWPNTVSRWLKSGFIPSEKHPDILTISEVEGLGITPETLIYPPKTSRITKPKSAPRAGAT